MAYLLEPFFTKSCYCSWFGIFSFCQTITKAYIWDSFFSTAVHSISFYIKNNWLAFNKWQCNLIPFYKNGLPNKVKIYDLLLHKDIAICNGGKLAWQGHKYTMKIDCKLRPKFQKIYNLGLHHKPFDNYQGLAWDASHARHVRHM